MLKQWRGCFLFWCCMIVFIPCLKAQQDSTGNAMDSFLLRQKGLLGKLARNIMANKPTAATVPIRNDLNFVRFKGKTIRNITIKRLDFGTPLNDTSHKFSNTLTHWANALHHKTREEIVRNNLFFKPGDLVIPDLLSDNERHLRDLDYIQDANIQVMRVSKDSVDIIVTTKDVLSIGGSFRMASAQHMTMSLFEDNLAGTGHKFLIQSLYDKARNPNFGAGAEYTARNINGSFVDWHGGYLSFNNNINTGWQNEQMFYTGIVKPLVHPYMKFTYAIEFADRKTMNAYAVDSTYDLNHRYHFKSYDAWIGWNSGAFKVFGYNPDNRLRTLVSLRVVKNDFQDVPTKFIDLYNYLYTDVDAVLGSVSVFRQDFYKTQYVYGLGRNEDIPEGLDVSVTAGWTKKAGVQRPYVGFDAERYFFTGAESYFNFDLKAGGYIHRGSMEDMNLLFNIDYFSRLRQMGKWRLRNSISGSFGYQPKIVFDEPLLLQSDFGLNEYRTDTALFGTKRITIKAESVFFAPWRIANFRFAPFVFCNASLFTPQEKSYFKSDLYSSIGTGLRVRNESLVFETIEVRGFYFPKKDFLGNHFRVEVNSHLRFKYNRQFIKKPDFVNMNYM